MAATYTLKVVTDFAASHILHGHSGKCANLHGHNWGVEVEVKAHTLNEIGMAIDFADIKKAVKALLNELDHRHLNDLPAFAGINPTAEHIARVMFGELSRALNAEGVRVDAVTIWETPRCCVRYTEE